MQRALQLAILTLGVTLASLAACEEREADLVDEPQGITRPIEEPPDPEVERWEYIRIVDAKLEDYERRIAVLEREVAQLDVGARAEVEAALAELERDRAALVGELERIKKASAATWEPLRPAVDRALDELETGYTAVVKELRPAL